MISVFIYSALTPESDIKADAKREKIFINFVRNNINIQLWKLLKIWRFHHYQFNYSYYNNIGDTAIRHSIEEQLKNTFDSEDVNFTYLQWGHLNDEAVFLINERADVFVIGGSGYLHVNQYGRANDILFHDLPYLKKLRCPIIAYGIGLNQLVNLNKYHNWSDAIREVEIEKETKNAFRQLAETSNIVIVRDELSAKHFPKYDNVVISSDPALFLNNSEKLKRKAEIKTIVGINFAYHGKYTGMIFKKNFNTFYNFCKEISYDTNKSIKYFRHSPGEYVVIQLLRNSGIDIEVIEGSPREMLEEYATCRVHVCQMLHSAILATNAGVPVVNIGYDIKNIGFFQRIDNIDSCMIASDVNLKTLLRKLDASLEKETEYSKKLESRKVELKDVMKSVQGRIRDLCGSKSRVGADQSVQRHG